MPDPSMPVVREPVIFGGSGDDWGVVLRGRLVTLNARDAADLDRLEERLASIRERSGVPVAAVVDHPDLSADELDPEHLLTAAIGIPILFARNGSQCDPGALDEHVDDPDYQRLLELSLGGTIRHLERAELSPPPDLWAELEDLVTDPEAADSLLFCIGGFNLARVHGAEGEQAVSSEGMFAEPLELELAGCTVILLEEYI